jgi:hypothetical protein
MNWVMSALSEASITARHQHYPLPTRIAELTVRQHLCIGVGFAVGGSILGKGVITYEKIGCDHIVRLVLERGGYTNVCLESRNYSPGRRRGSHEWWGRLGQTRCQVLEAGRGLEIPQILLR